MSTRQISSIVAAALLIVAASPLAAQPAVSIVKSTNGQDANVPPGPVVTVGSTVTWTYVVTSTGGRDLINIVVTDDRIGAVTCPATTLAAGNSMTCTTTGSASAGQYTNIGTVTADEVGGGPVQASDTSHYFGQPAGLISLVKSTNGQDANVPPGPVVVPGSAISWTYVVTNSSSDTLTAVTVTDDQGVVVTCPQATLTASTSMTCTANGIAQVGQYTNVGTVTATHPVFGTIVATDISHYFGQNQDYDFGDAPNGYGTTLAANGPRHLLGTNIYLGACVDAEIDGQPTAASSGDDTNIGTAPSGVCAVPGDDEDGVSFTSSLTAGQTASITVVANAPCTLSAWIDFNANATFADASDNIFPGGRALVAGANSLMFTVPLTALEGATHARFRCTTDGVIGPTTGARDGEVEDYAVTISVSADLSVTKTDTPDPVTLGTNLTYTIAANNAGPSNASTVTLTDVLPANTTFVSLSSPAGWSCTTPAVGSAGTVTCTRASLAPGNSVFTLVVAVGTSAAGTITNTATASSATADPTPGNNSGATTTNVGPAQADLSVAKIDTPDPVTPGTNLTYSITVNNAGPSDSSTVTLTDVLPANTSFVSLSSPAGWSCTTPAVGSAGTVTCTRASLAPGNADFTLVVAVAMSAAGTITNTATASSATTDPTPGNNSGTATTNIGVGQADLSVAKTDSPDPTSAGTNLTYTIAVNNAGPSAATTVTLTDVLPATTTFVSLTSPAGWSCTTPAVGSTGPVTCTIASLPTGNAVFTLVVAISAGAGVTISNTATISSATTDPDPSNNSGTATTTLGSGAAIPTLSPEVLLALLLMLAGVGVIVMGRGTA